MSSVFSDIESYLVVRLEVGASKKTWICYPKNANLSDISTYSERGPLELSFYIIFWNFENDRSWRVMGLDECHGFFLTLTHTLNQRLGSLLEFADLQRRWRWQFPVSHHLYFAGWQHLHCDFHDLQWNGYRSILAGSLWSEWSESTTNQPNLDDNYNFNCLVNVSTESINNYWSELCSGDYSTSMSC